MPNPTSATTREITVREFVKDLLQRMEQAKTIDCCKDELRKFAMLALEKMPEEKITVQWKSN